jgi:hypothetical protein
MSNTKEIYHKIQSHVNTAKEWPLSLIVAADSSIRVDGIDCSRIFSSAVMNIQLPCLCPHITSFKIICTHIYEEIKFNKGPDSLPGY